jgi:hypothetical protein
MISFGEYIIIALLAVILILQIFSMKSSPREGFQTATAGVSFDPATAVTNPNTCAIMHAIREQVEKNVNEAKQQNNTEIVEQLTSSLTELNTKISSMSC